MSYRMVAVAEVAALHSVWRRLEAVVSAAASRSDRKQYVEEVLQPMLDLKRSASLRDALDLWRRRVLVVLYSHEGAQRSAVVRAALARWHVRLCSDLVSRVSCGSLLRVWFSSRLSRALEHWVLVSRNARHRDLIQHLALEAQRSSGGCPSLVLSPAMQLRLAFDTLSDERIDPYPHGTACFFVARIASDGGGERPSTRCSGTVYGRQPTPRGSRLHGVAFATLVLSHLFWTRAK